MFPVMLFGFCMAFGCLSISLCCCVCLAVDMKYTTRAKSKDIATPSARTGVLLAFCTSYGAFLSLGFHCNSPPPPPLRCRWGTWPVHSVRDRHSRHPGGHPRPQGQRRRMCWSGIRPWLRWKDWRACAGASAMPDAARGWVLCEFLLLSHPFLLWCIRYVSPLQTHVRKHSRSWRTGCQRQRQLNKRQGRFDFPWL